MQLQIRANPTPTGQLCLQQLLMQQTNRFTIFHLVKMLGTKGVKSIACQQHASHAKNAEHVIRAVKMALLLPGQTYLGTEASAQPGSDMRHQQPEA